MFRENPLGPGDPLWEELQDKFGDNDHVQAVLRTISVVDIQSLHDAYRGTGSKPFLPESLLSIALVEILNGVTSPAAWHRDASSRDHCKFVGNGVCPSRTAWYDFRDRCGKFIDEVLRNLVTHANDSKLIDPQECSIDGTSTAAAASRHKIFNLKQINRRLSKLKRIIRQLDDPDQIAASKAVKAIPRWVAATPKGRQEQRNRYTDAKRRLLENIEKNRAKPTRYQKDESRMIISPADIDAVIGRDKKKVVRPLYNTQFVTDCASDVIVAFDVFAQHNDNGTLAPMIRKSQNILAGRLCTVHADSGYCSILDLQDCAKLNIDLYAPVQDNTATSKKLPNGKVQIASREFCFDESTRQMTCPGGHAMKFVKEVQVPRADGRTLGELRFEQSISVCSSCVLADRCFGGKSKRRTVARQSDQRLLDEQQQKMESERGQQSSRLRGQVIERRFADGKLHRNQEVQNGRGLNRVRAEVGLLAVAQNTLTLYNLEKRGANAFT